MKGHLLTSLLLCNLLFLSNCIQFGDLFGSNDDSKKQRDALLLLGVANQVSVANSPCPPTVLPNDIAIANTVVASPSSNISLPFKDPQKAINGVCGAGQFAGSTDVYSLGTTLATGFLTLSWNGRTVRNVSGIDFVVYENPFQYSGSDTYFLEAIVVEVSFDGTNFCGFAPEYRGTFIDVSQRRQDWDGFAGLTPVLYNMGSNRLSLNDLFANPTSEGYMGTGGGDGFDLDQLSTDNSFSIGCTTTVFNTIKQSGFRFVRLTNATVRGFPAPRGSFDGAPDIDGVVARQAN